MIQRDSYGLFKIDIDSNMIYCIDNFLMPWMQSEEWRKIVSM